MHELLVEAMLCYFRAGAALDLAALDTCYDDEFENVRVDRAGQAVVITKEQFMRRFREMKAQGVALGSAEDDGATTMPVSTVHGDQASIVVRRVKEGMPVLYTFVWRVVDGQPTTILREFTVEEDLTALLRAIRAAPAAAAR